MAQNEAPLAAIMVQREGSLIGGGSAAIPHECSEIAGRPLGINGALSLAPNRGD